LNGILNEEIPNGKMIAETVKGHIKALSARRYPESIEGSLEFTMMFLPSEALCSVALEYDPTIYHFAMERKILLVTPLSLVGFLTLVSSSWKSVRVDENAREMIVLGKELYQRVDGFLDHFSKLGRSLTSAVKDYNVSVGSFENRLSPSLRRFHDLAGESHHEVPAVPATIVEVVRDSTN
jgi:DNA recombination protein RmuC